MLWGYQQRRDARREISDAAQALPQGPRLALFLFLPLPVYSVLRNDGINRVQYCATTAMRAMLKITTWAGYERERETDMRRAKTGCRYKMRCGIDGTAVGVCGCGVRMYEVWRVLLV